ncbi:MAG: hypothetical protein ACRYE9_00180 [Janthinobacterium lividum]
MFDVFRRELLVIRQTAGHYCEGLWQQSFSYSFTIKASVQGSEAETLQSLPEGYRTSENYTLYTDTKLHAAKDIVVIEGKEFLVIKVTPWQHFATTSHYEVVVTKDIHNENKNNI